jgi:nicotinamidase-related amidase
MMVWNSLFYERAKNVFTGKFQKHEDYFKKATTGVQNKVLFVIDMQKDFIDRPYTRTKGDAHPVNPEGSGGGATAVGNFDVADGKKMVEPGSKFLEFIQKALNDEKSPYKKVVFTRDYHPVGHSSFSGVYANSPMLLCGDCSPSPENFTGNFPAHCVQGYEGTLLAPEIEEMILKESLIPSHKELIKILFKGMHKNLDSFTAVGKDVIDTISSNSTHKICKGCSSITGGYKLCNSNGSAELSIVNSVNYNVKVSINDPSMKLSNEDFSNFNSDDNPGYILLDDGNKFIKEKYDFIDDSIDTIEVTGLAGDYCVRDTVVALSKKYPNKTIVLLNDFTRYPALPFFTIGLLPQHKPESKYSVDKYTVDHSYADLADSEIQRFAAIRKAKEPLFEDTNKMLVLSEYAKTITDDNTDKDIIYYLLNKDLDTGTRTLMDVNELQNIDITNLIKGPEANSIPLTYHHFITPLESFIEDYTPENIQIVMSWIDKPVGETPLPVEV